jgi:dolichyl-phosphate beta-glucosyltransferase
MEALIGDFQVVAGARNAADSTVTRYQPIQRRAASLGFIFLCRRVMGEPLRDVFCGFKLFTADAARDVFARARIDGWAFDAEALALARALGYRVAPCGIAWSHRPGSRLSIPRIMIPVLRELIATRAHIREAALGPHRVPAGEPAPAGATAPAVAAAPPAAPRS